MMSSRGMGAISPSKMPKGKKEARRDDTDFTEYKKGGQLKEVPKDNTGLSKLPTQVRNKMGYMKEGGKTKSKVNEAGNYTKPELRKRIFNSVKAAAIVGTGAGKWSARKAQVMAKRYKAAGGGYRD